MFKKGHIPWNVKEKKKLTCLVCKGEFFVKPSKNRICCSWNCRNKYISKKYKGRKHSWGNNISKALKGKKKSEEHLKNMNKFLKGSIPWNKGIKRTDINGSRHPNWKGGISPEYERIRKSFEYKNWRNEVFKRDNYTCQITGLISKGNIIAHHLESFDNNIDLRLEINNGITILKKLHDLFHKLYGNGNNTKEQFNEFIFKLCNCIEPECKRI